MIRVVQIIDNLEHGGAQTMFKFFLNYDFQDVEFKGYVLRGGLKNTNNIIYDGSNSKLSLIRIFKLKKFLIQTQPNIVHLHLNNSLIHGYLLSKMGIQTNWLIHEHGEVFREDLAGKIVKLVYRKFKKAKFIAVSNAVKSELIFNLGVESNRINLLKNVAFHTVSEKENNRKKDSFNIGFVGRVIERKNWKGFLRVAELLKTHNGLNFIVFGAGPDFKEMQKEASLKKVNNISFMGWQNDLTKIFKELDVLLLLSKWEGFSLSQLEALSFGIPVISYENKGMTEIPNHNGICLVDSGNEKQVAEMILKFKNQKAFYDKYREAALSYSSDMNYKSYMLNLKRIYSKQIAIS